ncbi:hypothetical protein AVEN_195903-1, partial [Araneus ventricosus]
REKIDLKGIELLPHPTYSPNLAPFDYHMFRSMASFFLGRSFYNIDELELDLYASKSKEWYRTHTAHPTPKDFLLHVLRGRLWYPKEVAAAPKHAQRTATGNRMSA